MNRETRRFIASCHKHGIKVVTVGVAHPKVKASMDFVSGVTGSAFADEYEDGWPAIWRACEDAGVSWGCGNHGQHQIRRDHGLERGAYQKSNRRWVKIA